jgi:hypothetical protein
VPFTVGPSGGRTDTTSILAVEALGERASDSLACEYGSYRDTRYSTKGNWVILGQGMAFVAEQVSSIRF